MVDHNFELSYQGKNYSFTNKNAGHLILYLGSTPSDESLKQFLKDTYGNYQERPFSQAQNDKQKEFYNNETEMQQSLDIKFKKREPFPGVSFPKLKDLNQGEIERDMILEQILRDTGKLHEYSEKYTKMLLERADKCLEALKGKSSEEVHTDRRETLEETIKKYSKIAKEHSIGSHERMASQRDLEYIVKTLVEEFNL